MESAQRGATDLGLRRTLDPVRIVWSPDKDDRFWRRRGTRAGPSFLRRQNTTKQQFPLTPPAMTVLSARMRSWTILVAAILGVLAFSACRSTPDTSADFQGPETDRIDRALASESILTAGIVVLDQVYNTEVVAPYDVFEHTFYRDSTRFIEPFLVSPDGTLVTTAEGLSIGVHYSFDDAPPIDVLVVPSTANSVDDDLEKGRFLEWLETTAQNAEHVISVCNGAFPLAATGLLDKREVTTYPETQDQLAEQFPDVTVRQDVRFVADGSFVTSVGGARSYEPALHLVDELYGAETARDIAAGLVLPWNPDEIPSAVVR